MSVNNFIPEIWSAQILDSFDKDLVYGALANRDYEGEITNHGDTVRINEIGEITIRDYTKNSTTAITVQELTDAQQQLHIDQAKYFAFKVDDVDQAQTKPKLMSKAQERAGYALRDDTDQYLSLLMSTGANNFSGTNSTEVGSTVTPLSATSTTIINAISWYDRIMNQNNVPTNGRWIVFPPALMQSLVNARIVTETANTGAMVNGVQSIGNFYNFNIYMSNNVQGVPSSQWFVVAGHNSALTLANQVVKIEAYSPEGDFSDAIKGLFVYGAKVTRPNAIIRGVLTSS